MTTIKRPLHQSLAFAALAALCILAPASAQGRCHNRFSFNMTLAESPPGIMTTGAGYRGRDRFSFRVCGELRAKEYCTVIPMNVTVE